MIKYVVFDICINPNPGWKASYDTTAEFYANISDAIEDFQKRKNWRDKSEDFTFLPDRSSAGCAVYRCYDDIIEIHLSEINDIVL